MTRSYSTLESMTKDELIIYAKMQDAMIGRMKKKGKGRLRNIREMQTKIMVLKAENADLRGKQVEVWSTLKEATA